MFNKKSQFEDSIADAQKHLEVALFQLRDNPHFKTFLDVTDHEREAFIRNAYNPKTTDQDRLMCLGAINMLDIVHSICSHGGYENNAVNDE